MRPQARGFAYRAVSETATGSPRKLALMKTVAIRPAAGRVPPCTPKNMPFASLVVFLFVFALPTELRAAPSPGAARAAVTVIRVPHDYLTIQAAIDAATDTDIIQVSAGYYPETLQIFKSITLRGSGRDTTIIDAQGSECAIEASAPDITIESLAVRDADTGVWLNGSDRAIVRDCEIGGHAGADGICNHTEGRTVVGIKMADSQRCRIDNNQIGDLHGGNGITTCPGPGVIGYFGGPGGHAFGTLVESDATGCVFAGNLFHNLHGGNGAGTHSHWEYPGGDGGTVGGIYSTAELDDCLVTNNIVRESTGGNGGSGVGLSGWGGSAYGVYSEAGVHRTTFTHNFVSDLHGGSGGAGASFGVARGVGGSVRAIGGAQIHQCTFASNHFTRLSSGKGGDAATGNGASGGNTYGFVGAQMGSSLFVSNVVRELTSGAGGQGSSDLWGLVGGEGGSGGGVEAFHADALEDCVLANNLIIELHPSDGGLGDLASGGPGGNSRAICASATDSLLVNNTVGLLSGGDGAPGEEPEDPKGVPGSCACIRIEAGTGNHCLNNILFSTYPGTNPDGILGEAIGLIVMDSTSTISDHNCYFDHGTAITSGISMGAKSFQADPLFGQGYRLRATSPCIDAGTDIPVSTDLAGNPRPAGHGFDIGCFEYPFSSPDLNRDGLVDSQDLYIFMLHWYRTQPETSFAPSNSHVYPGGTYPHNHHLPR